MAGSSGLLIAGKLLAVIVLVFANGFFVAAEFALVAVRRSRVEQLVDEGRARAKVLQRAVNHLDAYLAATQLGVTMSSLGLGWLGEPAIAALIEPTLEHLLPGNLAFFGAHTLGVLIAFTIITTLHIVLGELAPKSLALQRPEETALFVIQLLELYLSLFRPAVYALNSVGNWVLRLLGLETGNSEELVHSPAEIQLLVSATREAGFLEEAQEDLVERVFRLGEQRVSALMTPRLDMVWLDLEDPIATLQQQVITSVHSNFLVCQESVDHPIGFLRAKAFLAASLEAPLTLAALRALLTPSLYIPESIRAFNALELFKTSGSHIAVVVDEYGATQGLVTLNDLLEAIVGDIHTGNEPFEPQAIRRDDGSWLIDGMLPIDDFKELFHFRQLPVGEGVEYQTIGGFILHQLGHIPLVSEAFTWNHFKFEIVAMDGYRIDQVMVMPYQTDEDQL